MTSELQICAQIPISLSALPRRCHHGHHEADGHSRQKKDISSPTLPLTNCLECGGSPSTRSRPGKSSSAALPVDGSCASHQTTTDRFLDHFLAAVLVCVGCGSGIVVPRIICLDSTGWWCWSWHRNSRGSRDGRNRSIRRQLVGLHGWIARACYNIIPDAVATTASPSHRLRRGPHLRPEIHCGGTRRLGPGTGRD